VKPNKVWVQQGRVSMTTSNFSVGTCVRVRWCVCACRFSLLINVMCAGISLNTGKWQGFGDINMNVLDSGSDSTTTGRPRL
jgi:hypothetical protein